MFFCFCIDFQRIKSEMSCLPDTKRWIHGFPLFQRGREFIHTKTGKSVGTLRLLRPTYHLFTIKPHDAINQSPGLRKDQTSPRQKANQIPHNCRKKWPGVSNSCFREGYLCLFFWYLTIVSDYGV